MVKYLSDTLDRTFFALSDSVRREILEQLAQGERSVHELAEPFPISAPAISRHLRVLEQAGLIKRRKDGRVHRIRFEPQPLAQTTDWMQTQQEFWESSLDALADYVERMSSKGTNPS